MISASAPLGDGRIAVGDLGRLVFEPVGVELDPAVLPHGEVGGEAMMASAMATSPRQRGWWSLSSW